MNSPKEVGTTSPSWCRETDGASGSQAFSVLNAQFEFCSSMRDASGELSPFDEVNIGLHSIHDVPLGGISLRYSQPKVGAEIANLFVQTTCAHGSVETSEKGAPIIGQEALLTFLESVEGLVDSVECRFCLEETPSNPDHFTARYGSYLPLDALEPAIKQVLHGNKEEGLSEVAIKEFEQVDDNFSVVHIHSPVPQSNEAEREKVERVLSSMFPGYFETPDEFSVGKETYTVVSTRITDVLEDGVTLGKTKVYIAISEHMIGIVTNRQDPLIDRFMKRLREEDVKGKDICPGLVFSRLFEAINRHNDSVRQRLTDRCNEISKKTQRTRAVMSDEDSKSLDLLESSLNYMKLRSIVTGGDIEQFQSRLAREEFKRIYDDIDPALTEEIFKEHSRAIQYAVLQIEIVEGVVARVKSDNQLRLGNVRNTTGECTNEIIKALTAVGALVGAGAAFTAELHNLLPVGLALLASLGTIGYYRTKVRHLREKQ